MNTKSRRIHFLSKTLGKWDFRFSAGLCLATATLLVGSAVHSATIQKADNTDNLNLTTSWVSGVVPGPTDIALWDGTIVSGPNSVLLGADLSWQGLKIGSTVTGNPAGPVTIGAGNTLTLGSAGIDMSAATQDLTISSGLTLLGTTGQIWNVATGRTLTLNTGAFTRSAAATLNVQSAGAVITTMPGLATANLVNGIIGAWASIGTGTSLSYATINGSNQIVPFTTATAFSNAATSATVNYDISGSVSVSGVRSANTLRATGASATYSSNGGTRSGSVYNGLMNASAGTFTITSSINFNIGNTNELVVTTNTQTIAIAGIIGNGAAAGSLTLTSPDGGRLNLTGANTFTGATTINSGILTANSAGKALGGTTQVTISATGNTIGTLTLGQANQINATAPMRLNGGTFNTGGFSQGSATGGVPTAGLGALTLSATSIIDLGAGASILAFADSSAQTWTGRLNIYNWTGNTAGGGTDQVYFGNSSSGLMMAQAMQVEFFSGAGTGDLGAGMLLSTGEIVPVPEPATVLAGCLMVGALGWSQRRRLTSLAQGARRQRESASV